MKVTAVVPVYNEERTIGNVLETLNSSSKIDKIVVINAGSTDNTPKIIKKFRSKKVRTITLKSPIGKGGTVKKATRCVDSDIVFMCDADLHGLKEENIKQILEPVETGKAGMCIGIRKNPIIGGYFIDRMILTGGERAILANIFKKAIKNPLIEGWGIESVLNYYCKKDKYKITTVNMEGVTHTLRSRKKNWFSFLDEIRDVIKVRLKLLLSKF